MAQIWAAKCEWKHGHPDYEDKPAKDPGQNLWAGTGKGVMGTKGMGGIFFTVCKFISFACNMCIFASLLPWCLMGL